MPVARPPRLIVVGVVVVIIAANSGLRVHFLKIDKEANQRRPYYMGTGRGPLRSQTHDIDSTVGILVIHILYYTFVLLFAIRLVDPLPLSVAGRNCFSIDDRGYIFGKMLILPMALFM